MRPFFSERPGESKFIKVDYPSSYLHKYQGVAIARFFHYFGVSANTVTILSLPIATLAAYCFATNQLLLGGLLFWVRMWFDSADGKLARLSGKVSTFGSNLDYVIDTYSTAIMFIGVWWSQYQNLYGLCWILLHYGLIFVGFLFLDDFRQKTRWENLEAYYSPFEEAYIIFMLGGILGIITYTLPFAIIMLGACYLFMILKRGNLKYTRYRLLSILRLNKDEDRR